MNNDFSLVLFSTDTEFISRAVEAGTDSIIVDWENMGKERRQAGAQTEINMNTVEDLRRVRKCTSATVLCRVNNVQSVLSQQIEDAISAGADEILMPMVRSMEEVEQAFHLIDGRCALGILIETLDAVEIGHKMSTLPLSRVYVGLNDLAIERGTVNIFSAVADGTVESLRRLFHVPFGFGGVTLPDKGSPIPCSLLIAEMARLDCQFSFLRRSFFRDIRNRNLKEEIARIKAAFRFAFARDQQMILSDHEKLLIAIDEAEQYFSATKTKSFHDQINS